MRNGQDPARPRNPVCGTATLPLFQPPHTQLCLADVQMSDQLTKSEFCEVIVECYPHLEGATDVNLEALFDTFDEDGGGTIDFKEFTLGVSKLTRGSMDEKMEFLFEIYDRNGTWLPVGLVVAVELVADAGTLCDGIVQVMAPSMLPS